MKKNTNTRSPQPQPAQAIVGGNTNERPEGIDNGDGERGTVNARTNQTRTQPTAEPAMAIADDKLEAVSNVAHLATGKGRRRGLLSSAAARVSTDVRRKLEIMGDARQKLAEAADLYRAGGEQNNEAQKVAGIAALRLYQGRAKGSVTPDEVSAALGDVFGYKEKADGSPSKTPAGPGEIIRKRIVRLVQAHEYAYGDEASKFYDGLPKDEVTACLIEVENGNMPVFTAYDKLADIRKKAMEGQKPAQAFDPKHIAKIIDALTEENALDLIVENPALQRVYGELVNVLADIDERGAPAQAA